MLTLMPPLPNSLRFDQSVHQDRTEGEEERGRRERKKDRKREREREMYRHSADAHFQLLRLMYHEMK